MHSSRKGFTLIELLVVISIIGLLSTLAVVALNSARQKSRDTKRLADVKQIQTALELFYSDNNRYAVADTPVELGTATTNKLCGSAGFAGTCSGTTYMGLVPRSPRPQDGPCTTSDNQYLYGSPSPSGSYEITFCLGGTVGFLIPGLHTANQDGIQ